MVAEDTGLENTEEMGDALHTLSRSERIRTYDLLAQGEWVTDIKDEVDVAGSTVHNYLNDFEREGLVDRTDGEYELTELGERVHEQLQELDEAYDEMI